MDRDELTKLLFAIAMMQAANSMQASNALYDAAAMANQVVYHG